MPLAPDAEGEDVAEAAGDPVAGARGVPVGEDEEEPPGAGREVLAVGDGEALGPGDVVEVGLADTPALPSSAVTRRLCVVKHGEGGGWQQDLLVALQKGKGRNEKGVGEGKGAWVRA